MRWSDLLRVYRLAGMLMAGGIASVGIASPVQLVIDRTPGLGDEFSNPENFLEINGVLYFSASDSTNNSELWRSDGTAAGTYKVREINPRGGQTGGSNGGNPRFLYNADGILYFVADMRSGESTPWLVTNLNPGEAPSSPSTFRVTGNTMFMFADNGTSGQEVFRVNLQGLEPFTSANGWCFYQ